MPRHPVWTSIADALAAEIAAGHYAPGARLPTEARLAERFGVNRHTVRRALAALAERGRIRTRQGAGAFVAATATDYPLVRRVRLQQNLAAAGRSATRAIRRRETRAADAEEAEALRIAPGAPVHVLEGVSFADGSPIAAFLSVFPAERLPGLLAAIGADGSITAALAACGVADYTRAVTRLTATTARPTLALALQIAEGAPLLRAVAVNVDPDGAPIEFGKTWFAGERVTLVVEPEPAPPPDGAAAP
jgi:GntR family phosphonate transport system transcriptional regulator